MSNRINKVAFETLKWEPIPGQSSRAANNTRSELPFSYQSAVVSPLPLERIEVPIELLELCIELQHKILLFDQLHQSKYYHLPAILLRSESTASSNIEHLTASAKNIALATLGYSHATNALLIAQHLESLNFALQTRPDEELSVDKLLSMHAILLAGEDYAGTLRQVPVWIGGYGESPHQALFVPPKAADVAALLENLCDFCNKSSMQPLIIATIVHAQFESIHPFIDGNGRMGRALMHVILRQLGISQINSLPLSAGLLARTRDYFAALDAFRSGEVAPIIEELIRAFEYALELAGKMAAEIEQTLSRWEGQIPERKNSSMYRLLPLLISQPLVSAPSLAEALDLELRSAQYLLKRAKNYGIVSQTAKIKRHNLYQCDAVLDLLDRIAAQKDLRRKAF